MSNIKDIVLHALIARIAYTDNVTREFLIKLSPDHTFEVDIPRERLDTLIEQVVVGEKLQDFIDWLTGGRLTELEDLITNIMDLIPYTSKTVYGKVKIGTGIDVAQGVISVTGGVGEQLEVTSVNYTVNHNPSIVICKSTLTVTLPVIPVAGYRVIVKNSTSSDVVTINGTVDGESNPVLNPRESFGMVYDGTEWNIV